MDHHSISNYMAHGYCFLWEPGLVWLHVVSDIATGMAYYAISVAMFYFIYKRRDLPFSAVFLLFGIFIFLCGATHSLAAYTVYKPVYWHEGIVKAITAVVSIAAAILLIPLIPKAIALPSLTKALEEIKLLNKDLEKQVSELTVKDGALREQYEFLQRLIDTIPSPIFYKDVEGIYRGCNKAFEAYFGRCKENIIGKSVYGLSPKELADKYHEKDQELFRNPGVQEYETQVQHADGTKHDVIFNKATYTDIHGNMAGLIGIMTDITERKKAEEALKESEKRHRSLFENMLDGYAYCRMLFENDAPKDFIYLDVNSSFERLTGLKNVAGRKVTEVIPGIRESYPELFEIYGRVALTGKPERFEIYLEPLAAWLSISVYSTEKECFVAVFDNVTERKKAEEALRDGQERLRIIFETSQAGIILVDPRGNITFANERMAEMFGCTLPELTGTPYPEHLHASEKAVGDKKMRQLIAGEIDYVSTERHYVRKDGSDFWGYLSGRRLEGPDGRLTALVGIIADITEHKKIEEKVFQISHDWEDTFNSISDMITIHDKDFNIIQSNKAAERILGLPFLEKTPDAKCFKYYHGTEKPPEGCPSCACLQTGKPAAFEIFEPHLGMFIEIRAIPRFDRNNNLIGLIHVVRDISERKKADEYVKRQVERMTALRSIDMAISSTLDLRVTLHILLEQVITQLKADAADVLLLDSHTMLLNFAAGRGFRTNAVEKTHIRLGQGFAGKAAMQYKTISMPDLAEGGDALTVALKDENFKAYFAVPLVARGQVKGVLEIFHRSPLEPDAEWLNFLELLGGQAAIAVDNVSLFDTLQRSHSELIMAYDTTIEGWSRALDYRDRETEGHSQRVTEIALKIARAMGMHDDELVHVRRGALLHDIGKLGVPDSILLKPGKLSEEEWAIMKKHPEIAFELLSPISFLRPAIDIPYCHHEKMDGTGYPRGLKGDQIPLAARIFALVDVWDALRSDRPYRPAWPDERVMAHIKSLSGSHFDPRVVETFLKMEL